MRSVDEGRRRMSRPLGPLLATGFVGGVDGGTAIEAGNHYVQLGIGLRAFSLAVLGGAVITLMTWMQHGSDTVGGRVVPAITAAFLLAGGQLNHAIVNSLLMFSALHTGHAPFGYVQWAQTAGWAALGNIAGGVGLVTLMRQFQVPNAARRERENPAVGVPIGDRRRVRSRGDRRRRTTGR